MLTRKKLSIIVLALLLLLGSLPAFPGGKVQAEQGQDQTQLQEQFQSQARSEEQDNQAQSEAQAQLQALDQAAEAYVRIQNQYTGDYLYVLDGNLVYGDPVETDYASHWLVVEEQTDKFKLQNRETGQWVAMHESLGENTWWLPVELWSEEQASEQAEDERLLWNLVDALTNGGVEGYVNIDSIADPQARMHIQDGHGWVQASYLPANWGTAQWKLESVKAYVRIKNSYTGDYLYELDGKVSYAEDVVEENPASHWLIEQQDDYVHIVNRKTGAAISRNGWEGHLTPLQLETAGADAGDPTANSFLWQLVSAGAEVWRIDSNESNETERIRIHLQDGTGYAQASNLPVDWGSGHWLLEDVTVKQPYVEHPEEEVPSYITIKNSWLELYMFEEDGVLYYGNMQRNDERGHWLVEEHDGVYALKNRATGHYVSLEGVTDHRSQISLVELELTEQETIDDALLWNISNMQTAGNKLISAKEEQNEVFLHVENRLGYVQYGAVPAAWGSPQWKFAAVEDQGPSFVRLKNQHTGDYLLQAGDKVAYATNVTEHEAAAHWQLVEIDEGQYHIKNRLTGDYIHIEGMSEEVADPHLQPLPIGEIEESWWSARWTLTTGESINIANLYQPNKLIHIEDGTGYAQASDIPGSWGTARWLVEAAPEYLPIEVPEGFVRVKNAATSQYLYENAQGIVLHGDLADTDGRGHWKVEKNADVPEQYTITNRLSGKQIQYSANDQLLVTTEVEAADSNRYWWIEPAPNGSHALIRSTEAPLEYVHLRDRAGYAQQSLQSIEVSDLYWSFEAASEEVVPYEEQVNAEPVTTSWLSHNQPFQLQQQNKRLVLKDGEVELESYELDQAASISDAEVPEHAQWLLWDYNGYQWLQHKATGLFVSWNEENEHYETATQQQLGKEPNASLSWITASGTGKQLLTASTTSAGNTASAASAASAASPASSANATEHSLSVPAPSFVINYMATTVKLEAEAAFARGGLTAEALLAQHAEGSGVIAGFTDEEQQLIFTVHAPTDGNYAAELSYSFVSDHNNRLSVAVNGLVSELLQLPPTSSWDEWATAELSLPLRQGLNTVVLSGQNNNSALWLDQISIEGILPLAYRGATIESVVYEAELAQSTGELLEPSRQFYSIAAESSARSAVKLTDADDTITFEVQQSANRLTLRYVLPDSEDGKGLEAEYGLLINGEQVAQPLISSQYAWVYGSYPWSNNPTDDNAHRFYDEHTIDIPQVEAGDIITIEKQNNQPYLIVDLIELAQAPAAYPQPQRYVSAADYGAVANDGQDDRAAIIKAMEAARRLGYGVYIPAGQYEIAGEPIPLADITIRGAGKWHTELIGYGFMGLGSNVHIYDLAIDGKRSARIDELEESAFDGTYGTGSILSHLRIDRTKTGIWINEQELDDGTVLGTNGLYVSDVQIRNTYADGINFSSGTSHSIAEHASIRYSGDDGMAMWANATQSEGNTFRYNTVELPWLASNIAIYGGKDVVISDNVVADTVAFGAGISVSTRHNPQAFEGTTVIARNTLLRAGGREYNWPADFGAVFIHTSDRSMDGSIEIVDNSIVDSTYQGISFLGEQPANGLVLERNTIDGAGTWGIAASGNISGSAMIGSTIVRESRLGNLREAAANFELKLLNQGYSFKNSEFYVTFNDQRQASLTVELGETIEVAVWTAEGTEINSANVTVNGGALEVLSDGSLQAVDVGNSIVTVEARNSTRAYSVSVRDAERPVWSSEEAELIAEAQGTSSIKLTLPEVDDESNVKLRLTWNGGYQLITSDAEEITITGLRSGSSYQFTLHAVDESGNWTETGLTATAATTSSPVINPQPQQPEGEQPQLDGDFTIDEEQDVQGIAVTAYQMKDEAWKQLIASTQGGELLISLPAKASDDPIAYQLSAKQLQELAAQAQLKRISVQLGKVQYTLTIDGLIALLGQGELITLHMSQLQDLPANQSSQSQDSSALQQAQSMGSLAIQLQTAIQHVSLHVDGKEIDASARLTQGLAVQVTAYLDAAINLDRADSWHYSVQYYDVVSNRYRFVPASFLQQADGAWTVHIPQLYGSNWVVVKLSKTFQDSETHWAKQEIERLASFGIINGRNDQLFVPGERVTRAEFAQLIANLLGVPSIGEASFVDVAPQSWYYEAASIASELQIAQGYEDGTFRPQQLITREQLVVMLMRTLRHFNSELAEAGAGLAVSEDLSTYADADQVSPWAEADVKAALALGLMKGANSDMLAPASYATRAEAAVFISRLLELHGR